MPVEASSVSSVRYRGTQWTYQIPLPTITTAVTGVLDTLFLPSPHGGIVEWHNAARDWSDQDMLQ